MLPPQDALIHNRDLLLALSRAAQTIQRARTAEDFYKAVGKEIKSLGGVITLMMVTEDRKTLTIVYTSYSLKLIRIAEKVIGSSAIGYSFPISPKSIYDRKLSSNNAEYIHWTKKDIVDVLPKVAHPMADHLIDVFNINQGIIAPLRVDDEAQGLMMVSGLSLCEEDVPILDSFAGQIATGLYNVRLVQKLEEELSSRERIEESLNHNRSLLLALGRAAQAVQLVREPEEIYRVVGEQIKALGYEATILAFDPSHKTLNYSYTTLSTKLIRTVEKMAGLSARGYSWPIPLDSIYGKILAGGKAEYIPWAGDLFAEALPVMLRPIAGSLMKTLKVDNGIIAPLHVNEEMLGLLVVFGNQTISQDELPAIDSFAGQVSVSLRNARLARQVENELKERKQAEAALRASEAKIHALLDAIPDIMFILDQDGKFLEYHTSSESLLYVSPENFLGKNIRDVLPPEMVAVYFSKFDQVMQGGESQLFEYGLVIEGRQYFFETHLVAYQGNCAMCLVRDVTRRKQAEEAVGQTERHYKALIEKASDGISLIGPDGKIKYASPSARGMFQYDAEEAINDSPIAFVHPDDLALVLEALNELVQNPAFVPTIEYRYMHKDGIYHWVQSTFSNLLEDPSVQAVVINFRDITERKNIEKALIESERYYRALIGNAADGILVVNMDGTIRYESPSVARILGYAPDALIGTNAFSLINPDDLEDVTSTFLEGISNSGFSHRGEYRLQHSSGEWRYLEIVVHYLLEDPVIAGIIINGRDITERKQAEAELRESEGKFHSVISKSADGIALTDETGHIIEFNDAFEQITGRIRQDVLGQSLWGLQFQMIPNHLKKEDIYAHAAKSIQLVLETGQSPYLHKIMDVPYQHPDGSIRHIQQRLFSIRTDKGWRLGSVSRDVTEKKRADDNLQSLYQMTATLSQTTILEDVYNAALDSLQKTLLADRVSILLYDDAGVMRFKAWRGLSETYRKAAEGHSPWERNEQNPQPVLVLDALADPGLKSLHPLFVEEGIGSLGFIPLVHQGKLLGKFMIYFNEPHTFSDEEIQLSQTIASHVAFAIFRMQAEEALRASEERYRILYEDNPSMYFTADAEGKILSVNKYVVDRLGYSVDELAGQSLFKVFHPEDQETIHQNFLVCLDHIGKSVQVEARKVRKDGTVLWVRESACAVHDLNGQVVVLLTCDDITERIQAQEARAASLAEMHALFASMQDAVLVIDRNGVYQKVAPTNPNKFYLLPEEVIGKTLGDFFPDEQVEQFFKVIHQVLETRETVRIEYQLKAKEYTPWFESAVSPMGANTTIWVARDITERKQVEAKLNLQSAALEAAANTIVITDRYGIIQWANSSFGNLTGYHPSEAIGKNPSELTKSGVQSEKFYKEMWDTILAGNIWHNELVNRRKDGSLYFEEMTITPLFASDGAINQFIAVKQDITERKHAEEALVRSEKAYRTLFENMPIGLYRTSIDGDILNANPSLIRMFGYKDLSALKERNASDYYVDKFSNSKFTDEILKHGGLSSFESEYIRRDQTTFWAEDYVNIIRDESGKPLYYEGSLIDITDRKKAENDLRQANAALQLAHSELKQMFEHEQGLARTDSLTGQTNRRYFFEIALREFTASIRYQRPLTIILFDIDGFKQVNDTFGHSIGDNILVQVARSAAEQIRDVDVLARYGGDEFIILLPQTGAKQAFLIAERIRNSVASTHLEAESSGLAVTLSIGVAEIKYTPNDEVIEDVIRRADLALYQAKKNGRNHAIVFKDENEI